MANSADPDLRSQLTWIYTVCKGGVYPGSAGQGLNSGVNLTACWCWARANSIDLDLIWVYTVCSNLSVQIFTYIFRVSTAFCQQIQLQLLHARVW